MKIDIARIALSAGIALTVTGSAHAQTAAARAAWSEAVRTGEVMAPGDTGLKLNELYPHRYAHAPAPAGRTREEVRAEYARAVHDGEVIAAGELGLTARELHPDRYPAPAFVAQAKTRAQVKAETREAIATGDVYASGEGLQRLNEQYPERYRRARALMAARAASAPGGS